MFQEIERQFMRSARPLYGHLVNLFDMDSKYADVISIGDAVGYLERVGAAAVAGVGV